jgi:hypothetical protein
VDTEKEAQKTRNDSKTARDKFNDIKKKRSVSASLLVFDNANSFPSVPISSIRRTRTSLSASTRSTKS